MGCERDADKSGMTTIAVAPGLGLGVNPGLGLYKEILDLYKNLHFKNKDGSLNLKTVMQYTTEILVKHGLKNINHTQYCAGVYIYPREYFCTKNIETDTLEITKNSYTIHHFEGTWVNSWGKFKQKVRFLLSKIFGKEFVEWLVKTKRK